jgi:hypothetical protein
MVIVEIFGGLGNQMFQYALGRNLSLKLNTRLVFKYSINITRTDFDPKDIPSIFNIFDLTGKVEKYKKPQNYFIKYIGYIKNKFINIFTPKFTVINESDFHFDKNILLSSNNCYLTGYWQSEKYFINIENLIREEFRIKKEMTLDNLEIAEKIKQTESVSIHLRGRDYITREIIKKIHFTCDQSYYERSISLITENIKTPHFFIFSDDPEWAKAFLKTNQSFTFVEGNTWNKSNYEDLRLMSLCRHNIIANSSFSWWGAWLNENPDKIVIAPEKWFNDPTKDTKDLIPESWIKI